MGSLHIIGNPFRHRDERLQRTELVVLLTPHIVTDCITEADGACLPQSAEGLTQVQNPLNDKSRNHLAKAHFHRAGSYLQQGNPVKARQQIDASLRLNKADPEALRLRNEIQQCFMQSSAQ